MLNCDDEIPFNCGDSDRRCDKCHHSFLFPSGLECRREKSMVVLSNYSCWYFDKKLADECRRCINYNSGDHSVGVFPYCELWTDEETESECKFVDRGSEVLF